MNLDRQKGIILASCAFGVWGVLPLYWYLISRAGASEILAHRIVWSVVFLGVFLSCGRVGVLSYVRAILRGKNFIYVVTKALLIGSNWLLFIWAINNGHVLDTSLGYFINPILSVFLGMLILKERINIFQGIAVAFITLTVLIMVLNEGVFPWIALGLAFTFGFYGLITKIARLPSVASLFCECLICSLPALGYLVWMGLTGNLVFGSDSYALDLLLIGSGLATLLPLVLFSEAMHFLPISMIGMMQFIAPTLQFSLGILFFQEKFGLEKAVAFSMVWAGVFFFQLGYSRRVTGLFLRESKGT